MKRVLITGASSGLGKSLALLYAQNGCQVIACGRNQSRLNELTSQHNNITTLNFEITDKHQVLATLAPLTTIDLAILNAGNCEYIDDVTQFDADLFQRVITTNLIATGYLLQALGHKITAGGRIAFVSSSVTYLPFPRAQAYGASKAGVEYLARTMALDLKKHNIHVSVIRPGFIQTPLTDKNNFSMPFLITSQQAAQAVINGLEKGKDLIEFPKRFILILKLLNRLPDILWSKIMARNAM
jgi:NAD(P)-dependent dehydrogenase (short-subunit alcohol dehydrogenase family)